jgi:tetratricopeptide (TPR) repeat protein
MRKNILLSLVFVLLAQWAAAQTPKWAEKARKAVFSVITYDQEDKILRTGNGFFVSESGTGLSDYTLFKDAYRAVVIDADGRQLPVEAILGANSIYDVVKFRVAPAKKIAALTVATSAPAAAAPVYLLPYSTQKNGSVTAGQVKEVTTIGGSHHYYTLSLPLKEKMVSCPVMNADGQVIGLAQKSSGQDTVSISYAVGASFALAQNIGPLSLNDLALTSIHIRKALPEVEDQALVYLFMASSVLPQSEYEALLNEFVARYPSNADGYLRRAGYYAAQGAENPAQFDKATADMEQALRVSNKKDDVHYNIARLIYSYQLSKPKETYRDWTYDRALKEITAAQAIDSLPVYIQLEGDILFAAQQYAAASQAYLRVTRTALASPASFYSAAKAKELAGADIKEVVALMDSCVNRCVKPFTAETAPYLLERARVYMDAEMYRPALTDYDTYYETLAGSVNDVFYYYREQAAFKGKQFQRALNDIAKAIELNPKEVSYYAEQTVINLRVARFEDAIKSADAALAIDPKYGEGYRLKGICQLQLKQDKEACANFAKAKELGDTAVDALIEKHCK